jgi:hypothetical protein
MSKRDTVAIAVIASACLFLASWYIIYRTSFLDPGIHDQLTHDMRSTSTKILREMSRRRDIDPDWQYKIPVSLAFEFSDYFSQKPVSGQKCDISVQSLHTEVKPRSGTTNDDGIISISNARGCDVSLYLKHSDRWTLDGGRSVRIAISDPMVPEYNGVYSGPCYVDQTSTPRVQVPTVVRERNARPVTEEKESTLSIPAHIAEGATYAVDVITDPRCSRVDWKRRPVEIYAEPSSLRLDDVEKRTVQISFRDVHEDFGPRTMRLTCAGIGIRTMNTPYPIIAPEEGYEEALECAVPMDGDRVVSCAVYDPQRKVYGELRIKVGRRTVFKDQRDIGYQPEELRVMMGFRSVPGDRVL